MTDNHEYNVPEPGSLDWHVPLNDNFRQLDADVEIRDADANRSQYVPKTGAKYFATDTSAVYLGDGTTWNRIESSGKNPSLQSLETESVTIGDVTKHASSGALEVLGSMRGQAIMLQNRDDSEASGPGRASITWVSRGDETEQGEMLASATAHPSDNHFSVYTRKSQMGDGPYDLVKRLDIEGGSNSTTVRWSNNSMFAIRNPHGNAHVMIRGVDSTDIDLRPMSSSGDAGIHFRDGGSLEWRLFRDASEHAFRMYNYKRDSEAFRITATDNSIDFNRNTSRNVVWESADSRPASPEEGQRFFDSSLGQPIWYDGSNWVDAMGSEV